MRWRDDMSSNMPPLRSRDRVLSGRLVTDGGTLTLAMELIDGSDMASIWGGSYPVGAGHFGNLSQTIIADLSDPLDLEEPLIAYAAADAPIVEDYWRARYLWSLREHGAIREALRLLTDLISKTPDYAPAHAALADIYAHKTA